MVKNDVIWEMSDQFIPFTWLGTARSGLEVYLREEGPMKIFKYEGSEYGQEECEYVLESGFPREIHPRRRAS